MAEATSDEVSVLRGEAHPPGTGSATSGGDRGLDELHPTEIKQFVEHTKVHTVARRIARGGRSAAEHLIAALRRPAGVRAGAGGIVALVTDRVVGPVVEGFTDTPLDRELALPRGSDRSGALAAFRLARHHFLDGRRVDMGGLAAELEVNRVTLYRWVGRREDLLLRVLWALTEQNLRTQCAVAVEAGETGRGRVPAIMARYIRDILSHTGFRRFLADEGDLAVRLLTVADRGFQPRLVRFVELLLREDIDAGVRDESVPPGDLAFVAVRILESFVYSTRITGDKPDPDRSIRILNVLLR